MKDDTRPEQFEALATRLRAEAGVDEVSVEKTWLERVQAMTAVVRRMSWVLAATFARRRDPGDRDFGSPGDRGAARRNCGS